MLAHLRSLDISEAEDGDDPSYFKDKQAICLDYKTDNKGSIGGLCFYQNAEGYGAGTVAHECFHAAMRYTERCKGYRGKDGRELEEFLAIITGNLVSDFWRQWYKRNPKV